MDKNVILKKVEDRVRQLLMGEGSGHDWWHVHRVRQNSLHIANMEKDADLFIVELAALLHDIADWKFHDGDETVGPRRAREILESFNVDEATISHVCDIIKNISFKGANVKNEMNTKEGLIVQDADRLDAIGAIGVGRTFAYGGHKGHEMHNPDTVPQLHDTFDQYKNSKSTTINHFYEKLLLLKDMMNTESAKRIAEDRHRFMEMFLERFLAEWDGRA